MASWRYNLRDASFRGVAMFVDSHDAEGGRRAVQHEYPLRNKPYAEDLGRKARRWTVEAYVLGQDYMSARDELIAALEKEGPGTLVHPYLGTHQAQVDTFRVRESSREGGLARFTITFLEAGQAAQPNTDSDTAWIVANAGDSAREAAVTDFVSRFSLNSRPQWVRTSAQDMIQDVLDNVSKVVTLTLLALGVGRSILSAVSAVSEILSSRILSPSDLASDLDDVVYSICSCGAPAKTAMAVALDLAATATGLRVTASSTLTENREQEAVNQNAVVDLVRVSALAAAAAACSEREFDCRDDAVVTRDELAEALDDAAADVPDALYQALIDLRVAVVRNINANGADLAALTAFTPNATIPALALAHRIYGDAARADEIISRNHIRRPIAVSGGIALEVLTDG